MLLLRAGADAASAGRGGALAAAALMACACACGDASGGVHWTARDSAGVEILSSRGEAPSWEVREPPVLELGVVDGAGPAQFYRVRDVELLEAGLVVANQGSEELRIFTDAGVHSGSAGGKGHGPQEFDGLSRVEAFADSLLTWDGGNQRLSVRRLDGTLVRTFQLDWFDGILFPVDLLGGAGIAGKPAVLAVTARYMSQLRGTGLVVDTALVSVYDMEGALIDSLARVPHNARAVKRVGTLQTTLGAPFTGGASLVGVDDGFCHTFGPDPEIRCRDRTGLRRVIRIDLPARPVTEADIDSYWEEAFVGSSPRQQSALRRMRDAMPFPATFPAFAQLLRDDRGRLWARRYRTPREQQDEWLVFHDGRWIGRLATPAGLQVMDVRGDRLAGVWRDSLGIEFVRVHEYRAR